jgi:hypothetical protein
MRANTVLMCCSLLLAVCALALGTLNFLRARSPASSAVAPPPARQEALPARAVAAQSSPSALSASDTLRVATESVNPAVPPKDTSVHVVATKSVYPTVTLKDKRVSIQSAAQIICRQAGVEYEFSRSGENAGPACRRYIAVELENATLEEALAQVVLKNGLRYRIEEKKLWLERPE